MGFYSEMRDLGILDSVLLSGILFYMSDSGNLLLGSVKKRVPLSPSCMLCPKDAQSPSHKLGTTGSVSSRQGCTVSSVIQGMPGLQRQVDGTLQVTEQARRLKGSAWPVYLQCDFAGVYSPPSLCVNPA